VLFVSVLSVLRPMFLLLVFKTTKQNKTKKQQNKKQERPTRAKQSLAEEEFWKQRG